MLSQNNSLTPDLPSTWRRFFVLHSMLRKRTPSVLPGLKVSNGIMVLSRLQEIQDVHRGYFGRLPKRRRVLHQ